MPEYVIVLCVHCGYKTERYVTWHKDYMPECTCPRCREKVELSRKKEEKKDKVR